MILHCTYEELGALRQGAKSLLDRSTRGEHVVVAPPQGRREVAALVSRLTGDLAIETLQEQRQVLKALTAIVTSLKDEMDLCIVATHPADEASVAGYFLYAHALAVLARLSAMGEEMEALIEVATGAPVTPAVAASFIFPN
jgi:hypothetical protein